MTKIDFYILAPDSKRDSLELCCILTEKAFNQNIFVVIQARDNEQAYALDEQLWQFKAESFIAHQVLDENTTAKPTLPCPVTINPYHTLPQSFFTPGREELLINLTDNRPEQYSHFQRLVEIVDKEDKSKQAARQRYRFYKDCGYPLNTFSVS